MFYDDTDVSQAVYSTSLEVTDSQPYFTGLYDADGDQLWSGGMDPIGFTWDLNEQE
jgi:hypothetical protein